MLCCTVASTPTELSLFYALPTKQIHTCEAATPKLALSFPVDYSPGRVTLQRTNRTPFNAQMLSLTVVEHARSETTRWPAGWDCIHSADFHAARHFATPISAASGACSDERCSAQIRVRAHLEQHCFWNGETPQHCGLCARQASPRSISLHRTTINTGLRLGSTVVAIVNCAMFTSLLATSRTAAQQTRPQPQSDRLPVLARGVPDE